MEYFYNNEAEYIALCNKVLIGLDDQIVELIKDNDWLAEFGYTSYQDTPNNIYDIWIIIYLIQLNKINKFKNYLNFLININ